MFVWARLPAGFDAAEWLPRALERDVAFVPGEHFFSGPPDRATLRLSFTTHGPEEIALGLERLAAAFAAEPCERLGALSTYTVALPQAPRPLHGRRRPTIGRCIAPMV